MSINEEVVTTIEGPIHVSFKAVKNTVPPMRYRMLFSGKDFVTSSKGTPGLRIRLMFDKDLYKEYEKKVVFDNFWFTPEAMNMYLAFLYACKINPEMLREEPIDPPQFNPDGSPVTQCIYSIEEQINSVFGAAVYVDVTEEEYDGKAADGVTVEKKWVNKVQARGYSKV